MEQKKKFTHLFAIELFSWVYLRRFGAKDRVHSGHDDNLLKALSAVNKVSDWSTARHIQERFLQQLVLQ